MSQPPPPPGNPYGQQQPPPYPYQQQPYQQPYQQPQYGYPPQPQQPYYAPQQQPPQRGGGNGKLIGIIAGAVATVLVVVGGVWIATSDTIVGLDDSGGKVIGYQQPTYNKAGRLIAVDTTTHQVTPYMELPESGKGLEHAFYSGDYLWIHNEHFFITAATVRSLGSAGADGSTQRSVAAFG
jgi:hypothetical protein